MGLFNSIFKKATKAISEDILESAKNAIKDNLTISNESSNNIKPNATKSSEYTIPERYNNFPKYPGMIIKKPIEKSTDRYTRLTFLCTGVPNPEYFSILENSGFIKGSDVRYDKDNTYVIVDGLGKTTEIVYHIKK